MTFSSALLLVVDSRRAYCQCLPSIKHSATGIGLIQPFPFLWPCPLNCLSGNLLERLTDHSLPSLPHPFHSTSRRPVPTGGSPLIPQNGDSPYFGHNQSTYQALHHGLVGTASSFTNYQSIQRSSPRMDEKGETTSSSHVSLPSRGDTSSSRLWGIELKWIS